MKNKGKKEREREREIERNRDRDERIAYSEFVFANVAEDVSHEISHRDSLTADSLLTSRTQPKQFSEMRSNRKHLSSFSTVSRRD